MANPRKTSWEINVTTCKSEKYVCSVCKSKLYGEKPFLELKKDHNLFGYLYIKLCSNCLHKIIKQVQNKKLRERLIKKYKKQTKRNIVRKL